MSEQFGDFLPSESDKLGYQEPRQAEKPLPLNDKEEREYRRLSLTEQERENNINIYGPALDDIEILLFQSGKEAGFFKNKQTEEAEEIKNIKVILKNIRQALEVEMMNLKKVIMDINQKEKREKHLIFVLVSIRGKKLAEKLMDEDTLGFLQRIFSSRFNELLAEQRRYAELSSRKILTQQGYEK